VVVFASDNGLLWGEHRHAGTGRWPHEESIRIPFLVRAPGIVKDPGRVACQMVLNIDLAPSLLELAGVALPANVEGRSFVPILESAGAPGRQAWLYEYDPDFPFGVPRTRAVRTEGAVHVEFAGRRGAELYDLRADPGQHRNLMGTPAGDRTAAELERLLRRLEARAE